MSWQLEATLDCQDCGEVVRRLSPAEAQQVANRPYDYIVLCYGCRRRSTVADEEYR